MSEWRAHGQNLGLLVLRLGLGFMFAWQHGWPKVQAGPPKWTRLGKAVKHLGIEDHYEIFGGLAAWSEFAGGLLLMLGLFVRPSAFLLTCTMFVAAVMHLGSGDGLGGASHAIEVGVACLALTLIGAGRYSLDHRIFRR